MASGDATIECVDGGSESVDFETLFRLRLSEKLDTLFADDRDLPTQFVLVPSLRDVFHEFVYPQVCRAVTVSEFSILLPIFVSWKHGCLRRCVCGNNTRSFVAML